MNKYDVIIVPGSGLTKNWSLPDSVTTRLGYVASLYKEKISEKIIVSGKWSINWDIEGKIPPTTEAEEMKKYLVELGVESNDIFKEEESKDTIGNAYFCKIDVLVPNNFSKILIVCADYHLERVEFLFKKILGGKFNIDFQTTPTEKGKDSNLLKIQHEILKVQKKFLNGMKEGDDSFLKGKFYGDPYYKKKKPENWSKIATGGVK